jgi:hypothetical protein
MLQAAKIQPKSIVVPGNMLVGPVVAARILQECAFERQRAVRNDHVISLSRAVENGTWLDEDQLTFCRLPSGRLILVNGYHRMHMVARHGHTLLFQVRILDTADMEGVNQAYASFDTLHRRRQTSDILAADDIPKRFGLSKAVASAVFAAIPVLVNGLKAINYQDAPVAMQDMVTRIRGAERYWAFAQIWQEFLEPASVVVRRKMLSSPVTAVGLATIKYQPQKARDFWIGVAGAEGLVRGDPRYALNRKLVDTNYSPKTKTGTRPMAAVHTAAAWSAFFTGRSLTYFRDSQNFRLAGTPWK